MILLSFKKWLKEHEGFYRSDCSVVTVNDKNKEFIFAYLTNQDEWPLDNQDAYGITYYRIESLEELMTGVNEADIDMNLPENHFHMPGSLMPALFHQD